MNQSIVNGNSIEFIKQKLYDTNESLDNPNDYTDFLLVTSTFFPMKKPFLKVKDWKCFLDNFNY